MSRTLRLDIPLPGDVSELEALLCIEHCLTTAAPEDPLAIAIGAKLKIIHKMPGEAPQAPAEGAVAPADASLSPAWQVGMPYRLVISVPGRTERPAMAPSQIITVIKRAIARREKDLADPTVYVLRERGGSRTELVSEDQFKDAVRNAKWQRDVCHELLPLVEHATFDLGEPQ